MMIKRVYCILSLLCLLILPSCKDFQEITVTRVDNFNLNKVSVNGIEGELALTIKNPNSAGFSIYKSEFDIYYGNVKLGKAKLHKRVHIGANSERTYSFKLKSSPGDINLMDVLKLAGNGGSGTIEIKGDLKVGKLLIKRKYPVNYKDHVLLNK